MNEVSKRLECVFEEDDDASKAPDSNDPALVDGRYRLLERLGSGAVGVVYKAEDVWLRRPAALKVIAPARENDELAVESLRKEALALAQIRHENVVQVYAFGPLGRSFYLAMEFVDGTCLDTLLSDRNEQRLGRLDTSRAIEIIRDIGRGLNVAHACGVIHRDVKPSNIVIERKTERAVLVDFGLARRSRGSNAKISLVGGTPSYMAPEQACDLPSVGPATDVYALACTAYELFTGEPPFGADDARAVLAAHLRLPAPELSRLRPDLRPLEPVLLRALAKDPSARHTTCGAFIGDLDRVAARLPRQVPTFRRSNEALGGSVTRILIFEKNVGLLRHIVRTAERTLHDADQAVEIECVSSETELHDAFAREASDIVIIDEDDDAAVSTETLGPGAEILVLQHPSATRRPVGDAVRALRKPINSHVVAAILAKMAARIAARRRSSPEGAPRGG